MKHLQVLQNKIMRIQTGDDVGIRIRVLLDKSRQLSVQQMVAYQTAVQVYNISRNMEPRYHYDRLFGPVDSGSSIQTRQGNQKRVNFNLSLARGSFFYQGSRIWAALPWNIRSVQNTKIFKRKCRKWIIRNININP